MPNRILKESICTSENIDQLSPIQEIAFYRLMVNCDDFGRMDARPRLLKARLFPLKDMDETDIVSIMQALEKADLIVMYLVDGKPYLQMKTWERHQQVRNQKSKFPSPDKSDGNQLQSVAINCNQLQSIDDKCPRNPIQSESISESESLSDDAAAWIAREHDQLIDAAERAGFPRTDAIRAKLIDLYSLHGLQKMLDGINACVDYGVTTIAYLTAVLKGEPKKKPGKTVTAQRYEQRDYDDEQEAAFRRMLGTG
jgi:hypothetical protein